nr:energy transducer TonB [uncultured Capnocytophaga sp.]
MKKILLLFLILTAYTQSYSQEEEEFIPYTVIEEKPLFPECKNLPKEEQNRCFKEQIDKHIAQNLRFPNNSCAQGRVMVSFCINTDGSITILGARGFDKDFEAEAKRLISSLPRLIPGKHKGKPTAVTYAFPVIFKS